MNRLFGRFDKQRFHNDPLKVRIGGLPLDHNQFIRGFVAGIEESMLSECCEKPVKVSGVFFDSEITSIGLVCTLCELEYMVNRPRSDF